MRIARLLTRWLPIVWMVAVGGAGSALAQEQQCPEFVINDPQNDCHFEDDETRNVIVDSRGGQGVGNTFQIDFDPDGNGEDFCPHCRLTLFTIDLGIDFEELEVLGVSRNDVTRLDALYNTLLALSQEDPVALAESLRPELEGVDLEGFIAEVTRLIGKVTEIVDKMQAYGGMVDVVESLSFDFSTTSIAELVEQWDIRVDTAFRADFDNPNDPRRNNSGIAVYNLQEYLQALVEQGVPDQVPDDIEEFISTTLESLPDVSGPFEISGDDDNAMEPATYHGRWTDLNVRQRTYVVGGLSAYLVEYTIVNNTTRLFPVVQASIMADFDVPPASYDLETDFDPATQTAMVYDLVPYEDPEIHYWFGFSPVLPGSDFVFANYNLDKNFTLAQQGTTVTDDHRVEFFLWDPDISGDHDDADGKSEKQGAISVILVGPLLPGEQRTIAFCFAGGRGGGSGDARAAMTGAMETCKLLYNYLTVECGNNFLEMGEQCDDNNVTSGDGCSDACEIELCGDGTVIGGETCDDGNIEPNDGCSDTCQLEVCGDGIVQGAEQCDDANADNSDVCLSTCVLATCGDGYLRECQGGDICGVDCGGYDYCWTGTFQINDFEHNTGTSGDLDVLLGNQVTYHFAFDVVDEVLSQPFRSRRFLTGPVHVEMSGPSFVEEVLAPALEGETWELTIWANPDLGVQLQSEPLVDTTDDEQQFGLVVVGDDIDYEVDEQGIPTLAAFQLEETLITVFRAETGLDENTDEAIGPIQGTFVPASGEGLDDEQCDDGNGVNSDECTNSCRLPVCGDTIITWIEGEQCDEGEDTDWCQECFLVNLASCGDNSVDDGEECDDDNTNDGDGCSGLCQNEVCGDGIIQADEACDDGGTADYDGCNATCQVESCGDAVLQPGEQCDQGDANSDGGDCTLSCASAACGDALIHAAEACDDGNLVTGDGCAEDCVLEVCGDAIPGPGEQCDDGNDAVGDGCSPTCQQEFCGDGIIGVGEQCDDANPAALDGCSRDCALENPAACGNGSLDGGEQCDDGGQAANDGCDAFCQLENAAACGNGASDPGEGCDDGNLQDGDGCSRFCAPETCGDGIHQHSEQCDDGNTAGGDGCDATCQAEPALCPNGVHEYGEQCDDGNAEPDDGCDPNCALEANPMETLGETCGNGALDDGEECDDAARQDGDGCDETCQLEATVCGNGKLEHGEECDLGDTETGDGCDDVCLIEVDTPDPDPDPDGDTGPQAVCGNGVVEGAEECDEGADNGEGTGANCADDCTLPGGGGSNGGCGGCATSSGVPTDALWLAVALGVLCLPPRRRRLRQCGSKSRSSK